MAPRAEPEAALLKFLSAYDASVQNIFLKTRALVAAQAPKAHETIWDAYNAVAVAFSYTGKWTQAFIHIAAYSSHVNLGLNNGATLPDPEKILEGSGNKIRHIKIRSEADLKQSHILEFVRLALVQADKLGFGATTATAKAKPNIREMKSARRRPTLAKKKARKKKL